MKKVIAIIRPMRLEPVKAALSSEALISGLTITDVRGSGRQGGQPAGIYRGHEYIVSLPPKVKIELIIPDEQVDRVVAIIVEYARTGEPGDGKVFVVPLSEAIRIRTGDRGDPAIQ